MVRVVSGLCFVFAQEFENEAHLVDGSLCCRRVVVLQSGAKVHVDALLYKGRNWRVPDGKDARALVSCIDHFLGQVDACGKGVDNDNSTVVGVSTTARPRTRALAHKTVGAIHQLASRPLHT